MQNKKDYLRISHPLTGWTVCLVFILSGCTQPPKVTESDWAQFKKDNYRSAAVSANVNVATQEQAWVHSSPQRPSPAWYGPAKEDAYARSGPLPSMRDYDLSFYPIIVGDYLYYGSSADDAIHLLDARTGEEKWRFTTGGPIRNAPTYYKGHLYFGSDDGFVYCIDAVAGDLQWKFSPSPQEYQKVLNNGRFISFWPVRTGVLIENDIAYFGASMLPWKKSYLCAIHVESGETDVAGTYIKEYEDMTLEGSMASTGTMLIQPQGRIAPVFFDKITGEKKGQLKGAGGCFVLVTPENNIVRRKTSRNESIVETALLQNPSTGQEKEETKPPDSQPEFMTFKDGKEMVVRGDTSFVLSETAIAAYHRKTKKLLWLRRQYKAHSIIVVGETLFVGGTDKVYGVSTKNGLPLWENKVQGTVHSLAFANRKLFVSTGEGNIYCFKDGVSTSPLFARNKDKSPGIDTIQQSVMAAVEFDTLPLKTGPFIQPLSVDSVLLEFETYETEKVSVSWQTQGVDLLTKPKAAGQKHRFALPVRKNFIYSYTIKTETEKTVPFEYDNYFNFQHETHPNSNTLQTDDAYRQQVSDFLDNHPQGKGLCLVLGENGEDAACEIAKQTDLQVVRIEESPNKWEQFTEDVQPTGAYGSKLSALKIDDDNRLPISSEIANLIWVTEGDDFSADDIIRLIAPHQKAWVGGIDDPEEWLQTASLDYQVSASKYDDNSILLIKKPIEHSGEWTHQYGQPDNSSYGGESLWGASSTEDFETQWMGRPGPRFQTDRSGRKPAPLAVNGRMFVQGNERMVALNAYNGTVLWAKDIPGLKRMNVTRDCSNWAADSQHLYIVVHGNLHILDQQTGDILQSIPVEGQQPQQHNWGYIAVWQDKIIGSSTVRDAQFTDYYGGAGWYDAKQGKTSYKVLSNRLFSFTSQQYQPRWQYVPQGAIINPTITIYNDNIAFVETRSANAQSEKTGRGADEIFDNTWLVNLDISTGKKQWEKRIKTIPAQTTYFLAAGEDKYVIAASSKGMYDLQVFDNTGNLAWKTDMKWFHGDHGGHMSKPAIVANRLVIKPAIYNLATGEQMDYNVPKAGHGCAHYALSEQSVFYRGGSVTQFNFDTRNFSKWERLRPDCWISTIPALGMVLSPEAGGGCSCGNWLETSMVMAPTSRAPVTINMRHEHDTIDFKQETWGDYVRACAIDEFTSPVRIELTVKPDVKGLVHYTIDGSEPTKASPQYTSPFVIAESTPVKVAVFVQKEGKERKLVRYKQFTQVQEEVD